MALNLTNSVTLDESAGLQTGAPATATEDNNDNDVALSFLQTAHPTFYGRLFDAGGYNLSTTFPTSIGVATNTVGTLSGGSTLLGFVQDNGSALPTYNGAATPQTVTASFTTLDGSAIYLCIDTSSGGLGDDLLLGVKADGTIVFAAYTTTSGANLSISLVQFEPIYNPTASNHDDAVDLTGLVDLAISSPKDFDLSTLPSGQNLFGMVGTTDGALLVIGRDISLKADGTYDNTSNTINTSQGGGPTTIGINNQMFDAGQGAYFTYVTGTTAGLTGTALDQNEADDIDNVQFSNTISNVTSAFLSVSQTQGNTAATLSLRAFDIDGTKSGADFPAARGQNPVDIVQIKVTVGTTTYTFNSDGTQGGITVSGLNGVNTTTGVVIAGLNASNTVSWTTAAPHDQVLVEGVAGKFDIGGFGLEQGVIDHLDAGDRIRFEDDGPSVTAGTTPDALVVDETNLTIDATGSFAGLFNVAYGTDGAAAVGALSYALGLLNNGTNVNSGLVDVATDQAVVLNIVGGKVVGTITGTSTVVFEISIDSSGIVELDQIRALKHPIATNPDDVVSMAANLVTLTATAKDKDLDTALLTRNIGNLFQFKDDGPSISSTGTPASLVVDDTDLVDTATAAFAGLFTSSFGADGAGALTYALSFNGGSPGTGLKDTLTGHNINLVQNGAVIEGRTVGSNLLVFSISVNANGQVTFTQNRAVVHDNPNDSEESGASAAVLNLANQVTLTATITDKDGDSQQAAVDITASFAIEDDGPAIGPIADDTVPGTANASVTNTLSADTGNDGGLVKITGYPVSINFGDFSLESSLTDNDRKLVYFLDADNDDVVDPGEAVYTLQLNTAGADSTWSYTFTVNKTLTAPPIEFDFNTLPSGQNLFGAVGTTAGGLIVIGLNPELDANGKYTNTSNTINTSKGGGPTTIGVNNQMFDPGEGAYFTYVTGTDAGLIGTGLDQNEADLAGNIDFSGTLDVSTASLEIVQAQGKKTAPTSVELKAFLDGSDDALGFVTGLGAGTPVEITAVRVYDSAGDQVTTGIDVDLSGLGAIVTGFKAGYKIEWDTQSVHNQVLVFDLAGKWDIGGFNINESQELPDQELTFKVGIEDGDGDGSGTTKIDDEFKIGIDVNLDGLILPI